VSDKEKLKAFFDLQIMYCIANSNSAIFQCCPFDACTNKI